MAGHGERSPSLARRVARLASSVALSAIAAIVCAAPASAQSAPMVPAAPPASAPPPLTLRAEGGALFCCADRGFIAGAGVAARPSSLDGVEVGGDAAVGRFGGQAVLYFAADGLYGVSVGGFRPYGGGGIGVTKTTGGGPTNTGAQIVAGVQWPSAGRHAFRVETRFLFLPAETTFVMGSYSF